METQMNLVKSTIETIWKNEIKNVLCVCGGWYHRCRAEYSRKADSQVIRAELTKQLRSWKYIHGYFANISGALCGCRPFRGQPASMADAQQCGGRGDIFSNLRLLHVPGFDQIQIGGWILYQPLPEDFLSVLCRSRTCAGGDHNHRLYFRKLA